MMQSPANKMLGDRWTEAVGDLGARQDPEWMKALRSEAATALSETGFPDRKVEAWKYTPMASLAELEIAVPAERVTAAAGSLPDSLLADAITVEVINGLAADRLPEPADGLTLMSLSEALSEFEDRLRPMIESIEHASRDRAFAALNTALLDQGLVVHVAANQASGPLLIRWAFSGPGSALMNQFRLFVLLEPGARLDLVEQFDSAEATSHGLNVVMQADLGQGSAFNHTRVQSESDSAILLTSTQVRQGGSSRYVYRGFDLGGALARHEFDVRLGGAEASADLSGAFVLDGKRHVDNHVSVDHAAPDCNSEQFFRGVLGGRSRGVFNGRALIRPGADGSSVHQSNANLLLSGLAEMDTKPELEIYADEVEASHGATVGQLDESAVFYLRTRGLSDAEARRMLTAAFCQAVTDRLEDRELASRIAAMVDSAMPDSKLQEEAS